MILGEEARRVHLHSDGRTTLDDIFHRVALRRPHALALSDPPNRQDFADGTPRALTYAQADAAVSALAERLRRIGLAADNVVAIQLPHTVESIVALLAVLRAGLIAAPLPQLWRRADCVAALSAVGAKALITCSRIGDNALAPVAMQVASELFHVRYVCGFGPSLPEGIVPVDDVFLPDPERTPDIEFSERGGHPAAHVAAVTFDTTVHGMIPVARSHVELLAGGLSGLLESRMAPETVLLSSLPVSSFAGLSLTLLPWLLTGGTLALHQPFDPHALSAQLCGLRCAHAVLPGPLTRRLADAGLLDPAHGLQSVLGVWRSPERLGSSEAWTLDDVRLTDVSVFGEIALVAAARSADKPVPLAAGPVTAPFRGTGGVVVADIARTVDGHVGFRGAMVPRHAFPPGSRHTRLHTAKAEGSDAAEFVDTGFTCRIDPGTLALIVTGPPAGLVTVGGYRFALRDLQDEVARNEDDSSLAAFPDAFAGHRLAGQARDRARMRQALASYGANPLVVRAFRERGGPAPPA